jgi:predicted phosphate transport protein (TIGR00153 family)
LIPREARFFELFGKEAALVSESLTELSSSLAGGVSSHPRLRDLEHECDDVARDIYKLTNLTFTTPLERDDILRLTGCLDDVVDLAEEISDKVDLYRAAPIPDSAKQLGECLAQAGAQIEKAISNLEKPETLAPVLQEIHRLENDGDQISREALRRLFNGSNQKAADVIKWKDLYDLLEATIDQCESVAEVIETIALKNG